MEDELIPERLLRALRYVDLIDRGGGVVTNRDIDVFMSTPPPNFEIGMNFHQSMLWRLATAQGSGVGDYLVLVGWIQHGIEPPRLTSTGRAILKASAPSPNAVSAASVTVLSPEDPLNLFSLTGTVAEAKGGLLAEPYFMDEHVPWLIESTSITRLLLCRKESKRSLLAYAAGAAEQIHRTLEIRCLPPGRFHDRYLVAEDSSVSMIGASLNGLQKHFTVVVPIPAPGAEAVRAHLDDLWELADRIEPRQRLDPPEP